MSGKNIRKAAIVLAAGQGRRMNSHIAKQYLELGGKPVLFYSLETFQKSDIDDVILVAGVGDVDFVRISIVEKYHFTKVRDIVAGGKERYHSVWQGLCALKKWYEGDNGHMGQGVERYVFIHDGARPFLTERMLEDAAQCVRKEKACVVGMPVKDTIKIADGEEYIADTPPRSLVWMMQTPQVFTYELIRHAYQKLIEEEEGLLAAGVRVTDDAGVVELFENQKVKLVRGSYENIKITTPEDLVIAEAFLSLSGR